MDRKPTGRAVSMPGGLMIGAAFQLIWSLAGAAVVAKLVDSEAVPETAIGYGALLILLTASFGGAMLAYGKIKRQRVMVCLLSGCVYLGMLLAVTALFFGGQYSAVGVTALAVLGGSGTAVLLGLRGGGGKRRRIYRPKGV